MVVFPRGTLGVFEICIHRSRTPVAPGRRCVRVSPFSLSMLVGFATYHFEVDFGFPGVDLPPKGSIFQSWWLNRLKIVHVARVHLVVEILVGRRRHTETSGRFCGEAQEAIRLGLGANGGFESAWAFSLTKHVGRRLRVSRFLRPFFWQRVDRNRS